ncbi:MAG: glycosyltransferase family 39 protein [Xanthobacteraceae bacterium]
MRPIDRWFDLPGDRAIVLLLLVFVVAWTAFHVVSRASVDLHPDLLEIYAWSRHPVAGYYKHPPLGAWVAWLWFAIFPIADWSFDLLTMVNAAVALFATDRIARLYLTGDKRLLVLLLLLLTPFYQFHAQRFGANPILLAPWPIATWCFLRAFKTHHIGWSAAAGAAAGVAMLGKYYSVYLVAAFILAALAHPDRWSYLRSASPWISIAAGLLVLAPHLQWVTATAFTPFAYVYLVHGGTSLAENIASVGSYLLGSMGYIGLPVVVYCLLVRPDRASLMQTLWPSNPDHRMLVILLGSMVLLPAISAPFLSVALTSLWTMPAWFLLPIVLLAPVPYAASSSSKQGMTREKAIGLAAIVLVISVGALLAAPFVALSRQLYGSKYSQGSYRLLTREVMRGWRRHTDRPLTIAMGGQDLADALTFYSEDHPDAVPEFNLRLAPWVTAERMKREGYVVVCDDPGCVAAAERQAPSGLQIIRRDVEVTRRYLWFEGRPAHFAVILFPPPSPSRGSEPAS